MTHRRDSFYEHLAGVSDWDDVTNAFETARRLSMVFDEIWGPESLSDRTFLDAGSGGGHFSAAAIQRGAKVTSLDIGPNLLAQVAARCDSERVVGDLLALPFEADSFDYVLCTEAIEHTRDPRRALRELARVAACKLLITTPGRLWQPVVRAATRLKIRPYEGHENFLWPQTAARVLADAGIQVHQLRGFNLLPIFEPRFENWHRRWDRLGGRLVSVFVNYVVAGEKFRGPRSD